MIRNFFKKTNILKFRNLIGLKPTFFNINNKEKGVSYSDGFFWRLDDKIETKFRYTNLIKLFYKQQSYVELLFFDHKHKFINKIKIKPDEYSNEFLITRNIVGSNNFGVFYIFHKASENLESIIRNSCYVGYSYKKNLFSFVHGNTPASKSYISSNKDSFKSGVMGSSFEKKKYIIQNSYKNSKIEVVLQNSSDSNQKISVNKKTFYLESGNSKIIDFINEDIIIITSNCYLLRPIVFEYKNNYLNVHHG
tara:strand:- start:1286 stop:2035 length:750 start_codon:yes stop_codon:yes gene_type:complete